MELILKNRTILIFTGLIACISFLISAANYPLLSLVAAFGMLVFLISLRFKEKVFFAFIFLYPLLPSYFAFDPGGSFPLLTIGRLLLVYAILFDLVFNREKFRRIKEVSFGNGLKLLLFSIVLLLLSFILNYLSYPSVESFKIIVSFLLENIMIGVYIFLRAGDGADVDRAVKCFLFAALVIAFIGIVEFLSGTNLFSRLDIVKSGRQLLSSASYQRLGRNRIEGPFGHPLAFCNFLLMAIPIGIYKWRTSKSTKVKTAYFGVILLLLVNFFLTLSRGPMLALVIGLILYFIFSGKRTKQVLFMLGVLFVGALVAGLAARALPGFVRNFFMAIFDAVMMRDSGGSFGANGNASVYRLYLFDLARKLVGGGQIWVGRGMSFFRLNEVYDWVPGISNTREIRIVSIDNYYILKYIEMGLAGLISTLAFISGLVYSCIKGFFRTLDREFNLCFLFIFISYFVSLFTVDEIGTLKYLWLVAGIAAAKISMDRAGK
ncbi:MAG TPA: O-antigen ligase family protein [Clostridia bacterium]|nr:O-antigen ligase family protein [Clostridia bacterium]